MLDLKFIRENTELVRQAIANRQDTAPVDEILQLDSTRRRKILELEGLRHVRKEAAREKREVSSDEGRSLRGQIRALEEEVRSLDKQLEELLLQVPNIPHPTVPVGKDEEDDIVVRSWGEPRSFDFEPAPHWKQAV
ncbi:unnamed protein product [marine sediment metagenome]|uniref:Seryl-tRNA(Ser/Sec) synthetase n=1 Tax=marine sediment metagenome TaxID=412755 RepID=X1AGK2_9ZZZZ